MAEDAGERIVEIQRNCPGQLQRAVELLFVRHAGVGAGAPAFGSVGKQLHQKIFLACVREWTHRRHQGDYRAVRPGELETNGRDGCFFRHGQKLFGRDFALWPPKRGQGRGLAFE